MLVQGTTLIDPVMRRAAFIATAITVPLVVVLGIALAPKSSNHAATTQATAAVSVAAPTPSADAIEPCAQVLSALPVQLDGNNPRIVHPYPDDSAAVVAWGNPAIVLQCGVSRPTELSAGSSAQVFPVDGDVTWLPISESNATVFIAIDRAVYVSVTVPKSYQQPPLATISDAIGSVLPAVCHFPPDVAAATVSGTASSGSPSASPSAPSTSGPVGPLCTRRP